jgi:fructose-bisphosphate aldolase, class II
MLTPTKTLVDHAKKEGYALGAFNISNLESILAVCRAATQEDAPVIIQITESSCAYSSMGMLTAMVNQMVKENPELRIALHLDHGGSEDIVRKAIDHGFTSVMFDGSSLSFEENKKRTSAVVSYAREMNVAVQAELGMLLKADESPRDHADKLTEPTQAKAFVEQTGIDYLAPAIGNVHGFYQGEPQLDFERLRRIAELTGVPLVLHGGSGIPDTDIKTGISLGIHIINIDTELRKAFTQALESTMTEKGDINDARKLLAPSTEAMQRVIQEKMQLFGSSGKASMIPV